MLLTNMKTQIRFSLFGSLLAGCLIAGAHAQVSGAAGVTGNGAAGSNMGAGGVIWDEGCFLFVC